MARLELELIPEKTGGVYAMTHRAKKFIVDNKYMILLMIIYIMSFYVYLFLRKHYQILEDTNIVILFELTSPVFVLPFLIITYKLWFHQNKLSYNELSSYYKKVSVNSSSNKILFHMKMTFCVFTFAGYALYYCQRMIIILPELLL